MPEPEFPPPRRLARSHRGDRDDYRPDRDDDDPPPWANMPPVSPAQPPRPSAGGYPGVPGRPGAPVGRPRPQSLPAAVLRVLAARVFPSPPGVQAGTAAPRVPAAPRVR